MPAIIKQRARPLELLCFLFDSAATAGRRRYNALTTARASGRYRSATRVPAR